MEKTVETKPTAIRLAGIIRESIVDGPGFRFAIFCQGCPHNCPDCHNPETHDFFGGKETEFSRLLAEIDKNPLLAGVTFSGGEPFCQAEAFAALAQEIKKRDLNIVTFTGYTYEQLLRMAEEQPGVSELLACTDLLIDGPFIKEEKDLTLQFRGSRNQRILDMEKTRREGTPVLWEQGQ
ncbi:anaerobic ribonucleoside-triphosphate reductase activating protein [bacterium 210820-DFI.6.37]|nr:anaerobic ribonucleoside-triphosphate reductase activating protein [bacterium 210820-DFI.6.37]